MPSETEPRAYLANLDFEAELAAPEPYRANEKQRALRQDWAWVGFLLAEPGEAVVCAKGADETRAALSALGLEPPPALSAPPKGRSPLRLWGVTPSLRARSSLALPEPTAVRRCHSKLFAQELSERLGLALDGSAALRSSAEVSPALKRFAPDRPWVMKRAFSMAGRGALRGRGPRLSSSQEGWLARALREGGLVIQPWLSRRWDGSILGRIAADGRVDGLAITAQLIRGQTYLGTRIGAWQRSQAVFSSTAASALEEAGARVAEALAAEGYFGPFGVDAMITKEAGLVPIVEINARATMGHAAQSLAASLKPGEIGNLGRWDASPLARARFPSGYSFVPAPNWP